MKIFILMVLLIGIACVCCGCRIHQAFILPMGIRSSTQQMLVAEATKEAFKTMDLTDLQGKKVYLDVNTLSQRNSDESPEETYISSHLGNELLKVGAVVVQEETAADVALIVNATAGADFVYKEIPIILFTYLTKGCVSYKAILYKLPERKILSMKEGKDEQEYKETYVLGFIGPFH